MKCDNCGSKERIVEELCHDCGHPVDEVDMNMFISKQKVKEVLLKNLKGINATEDHEDGWWETTTGAVFGHNTLEKIFEELELE